MSQSSSSAEARFIQRALAFRAFLRDPVLPGLLLMTGVVIAGFAAIAIGWYGAARTIYVPLQFPELVSGGIGGLALIGVGVALFHVQSARRDAAQEKLLTDDLLDEVAELVSLAPRLAERRRGKRNK